jgi:GH15 family glucan-1,4-alpha-glucosidase
MDAMFLADQRGVQTGHQSWLELASLMDWLCEHWDQPDEGIWETRGGRKNFLYGRVQCWVALDRAVKMATSRARPADLLRWRTERDAIYNQIFEKGWNPRIGGFTQFYGSEVLDSSLLMMPQQGLIAPKDPMWPSTASWSPTASSTAITRAPHRTGWPATRARSRSAPSGTSTPSPGRAASTRPY